MTLRMSARVAQEARDLNRHWETLSGAALGRLGTSSFVQAPAEAVPSPDGSFDAITARQRSQSLCKNARCPLLQQARSRGA